MTLAPLVPAEPDESVSARVAAICQLRLSDPIVNAVMCLGERDYLSWTETLERMVIELARSNAARLEELIRIASERPPTFIRITDDVPTKAER